MSEPRSPRVVRLTEAGHAVLNLIRQHDALPASDRDGRRRLDIEIGEAIEHSAAATASSVDAVSECAS